MKDTRKFKDGDIVFVNSTWHTAEKCKVTSFAKKDSRINKPVYTLHSFDFYNTFCATEDCIFNTKEDAISAYETEYENEVKSYCEQIKTLKDLVRFPIDNCLNGEEYTDYPALEAYKIRAREMITVVSSSLLQLISEYADKHELATECGSEYIYQDDEAQEDAIKLVADIFDDYCNTPLRISHEELFDE